jgi:anti-sigma factor RsiW
MIDPRHMNETVERLMTRRLDGEITAEESLALDKLLIRDPQLRDELQAIAHVDALSGDVIRALCGSEDQPAEYVHPPRMPWWRRRWTTVTAAACLVLWMLWPTLFPVQPMREGLPSPGSAGPPPLFVGAPANYRSQDTRLDWLYDEDRQTLYLLETRQEQHRRSANPTRQLRSPGQM